MSIKSRQLDALQGDRAEYVLTSLPLSEREWLVLVIQEQVRTESDPAHINYFAKHQLTVLPKLGEVGPLRLSLNEVNYLLFTLGGVAATAKTEHDHKMGWRITSKLIALRK